jgi:hypothetical protein
MLSEHNLIFHITDHEHTISNLIIFISNKRNKLTGIQWQLKVNFETSSHIPARHGFGSHGFVQFWRWISELLTIHLETKFISTYLINVKIQSFVECKEQILKYRIY